MFKGMSVSGAKVTHHNTTGLPSLTGIVGLGDAFAATLATELGLKPTDFVCNGVLFAFENYHLHEGFKRVLKQLEKPSVEALPQCYASFVAHMVFIVEATTEAAGSVLNGRDLNSVSTDVMRAARLCGGRFDRVAAPVNLGSARLAGLADDESRAIAMLPSHSTVLNDATLLVAKMREAGLPLMEGLLASVMYPANRPAPYKEFFENPDHGEGMWRLAPVQDGFLVIDNEGTVPALRVAFDGSQGMSHVASPTLSLVRLQKAASVKLQTYTGPLEDTPKGPFWRMRASENSFFCTTS